MSHVWNFFKKVSKKVEGREKLSVICQLCQDELSYNKKDASTSNMKKHLERKHPEELKSTTSLQTSKPSASKSSTSAEGTQSLPNFLLSKATLSSDSPRAKALTRSILNMLVVDMQPLSFVEDTGFKSLMKTAEPRYIIPSRSTFRNKLIPELYQQALEDLKLDIKQHFDGDGGTVSITTDAWSSRTACSYITYTLHFIREDFSMASYNIGTFEFTQDHTAINLQKHLTHSLAHCGILKTSTNSSIELIQLCDPDASTDSPNASLASEMECENAEEQIQVQEEDDVILNSDDECEDTAPTELSSDVSIPDNINIFITTDNAANISKAVCTSDFYHVRCLAHTLNIAVQKGLQVPAINSQLSNVRKICKYFHKSNKAKYSLQVNILVFFIRQCNIVMSKSECQKPPVCYIYI